MGSDRNIRATGGMAHSQKAQNTAGCGVERMKSSVLALVLSREAFTESLVGTGSGAFRVPVGGGRGGAPEQLGNESAGFWLTVRELF